MKKRSVKKKILAFIMAVAIVCTSGLTGLEVEAAGNMTLADLQAKFPGGKYWNHAGNPGAGNSVNNQDGWTTTPCSQHGVIGTSKQTCNGFQPGNTQLSWQCMGFAEKLGYDFTGYNPRNNANGWYTYTSSSALNNLKPGDIVRYKNDGHSIFVTAVNGDTVTFGDCNGVSSNQKCVIRWGGTISKSTLRSSFTHVRSAPFALDTAISKPTNPTISKNQYWYDLQDTIEITAHADNATSYYMSMFKDGERIYGQGVSEGKFTLAANIHGIGEYSVYFSCSNSLGTVDTEWLTFSVVGDPGYSDVWTSKAIYDLNDTVSISVSTVCADGQVIGIDRIGDKRVITEGCDSTYSIAASSLGLGHYSAYFSVYNGSGGVDTERVEFVIAEPCNLGNMFYGQIKNLSTNKYLSNVNGNVEGESLDCDRSRTWRFERQNDGSYKILSSLDDRAMDVTEYGAAGNGTNVQMYNNWESTAQKFYIYDAYGAYYFKPLCCDLYLDMDINPPHNLAVWGGGKDWPAQEFEIIKVNSDDVGVHKYVAETKKEATCTEKGTVTYTCSVCGDSYTKELATIAHEYSDEFTIDKKATCTEAGSQSIHCKNCDATKDSQTIPTLGHKFTNYISNNDGSCTEAGTKTAKCDRCTATDTIKDALADHSWNTKVTIDKEATCTEAGRQSIHCKNCDATKDSQTIPALGHKFTNYISNNDGSCTEAGTKTAKCERCTAIDTIKDALTDHSWSTTVTIDKEATCTEAGSQSIHCKNCDATKDSQTIPALGHKFTNYISNNDGSCIEAGTKTAKCERCTAIDTIKDVLSDHSWNATVTIDKEATCTKAGSQSIHCKNCDATKDSQTIPALGHKFTNYISNNDGSCTEAGTKTAKCDRCTATDTIEDVKADHSWNATVTIDKQATCTEAGSQSIHCENCDATKDNQTIPALGHDYEEKWTIDKEATEEAEGSKSHHCKNCDAKTDVTVIPKLEKDEPFPELKSTASKVHSGHTYVLYDLDTEHEELFKNWTKVKEYCESIGGHLVTITSYEEQAAVSELLKSGKTERYWLGATDAEEEGVWKWVTGEAFSYNNWRSNEPNNENGVEHYAEIKTNTSLWNDAPEIMLNDEGKAYSGFICEFNKVINPFVDVNESNYYYNAVLWALENGITTGKDATHFQPTADCTRAQVVTFLWRSQGCPEPKTTKNPFVDVPEYAYYYKAVLWAYENGITTGKDATHFQPDVTVTRNQFVTFLWRAEGNPSPTIKNPFVDVENGKYYTDAILWAYENGITAGKDATHFQPMANCQRCQVVTFLYRAYK